jgi:hypothetical protein
MLPKNNKTTELTASHSKGSPWNWIAWEINNDIIQSLFGQTLYFLGAWYKNFILQIFCNINLPLQRSRLNP